jgi:hypothetical protein
MRDNRDDRDRPRKDYVEIWSRFRPCGDGGGEGRWTDEGVAFLVDMFPPPHDRHSADPGRAGASAVAPFWFPTVALNVEFKKPLPRDGVEWLYSRAQTKLTRSGRTDIEVVLLDEAGEVVALGNQVALVVDTSRNTAGRVHQKGRERGRGVSGAKI